TGRGGPDCPGARVCPRASRRSPARFGLKTPAATAASLLVSMVIALSPRSPQRSQLTGAESGALRAAAAGGEIGKNRSERWKAGSGGYARSGQPRPEARHREIEKGAQ